MNRGWKVLGVVAALIVIGMIAFSAQNDEPTGTDAVTQVAQASPAAQQASATESADAQVDGHEIVVYKSPTCGCCENWIDHLREHGFEVEAVDRDDLSATKTEYGVEPALQSCHTAVIDGYVIEGHVPADLIKRFVAEKPADAGLAVPGMPVGSPGMEGFPAQSYDVFAFGGEDGTRIYASR